jgi:cytochrome c-type biogenesis protein CcsB
MDYLCLLSRFYRLHFLRKITITITIHDHDHDHDHNHSQAETPEQADHSRAGAKATYRVMSEEHSDEIATLLVQDFNGRIVPMHTLCDQLLRKVYRGNTYKEWNAVQTVVSMHMHPEYWMDQQMVYVSTKGGLRDRLKAKEGYVSYNSLVDPTGNFVLLEDYRKAHQKLESRRDEFDKQLIKLAERFEVIQSVFAWRYMNIIPVKSDPQKKWYSPLNLRLLEVDTSGIKKGIRYLAALDSASADLKMWKEATVALNVLKDFQYKEAGDIAPKKSLVEMEVSYNKMNVFKRSYQLYLIIGIVSLIVFFAGVFRAPTEQKERRSALFRKIITVLSIVVFVYHGYGLYMRWMISGHAPWSNGYEAVIFIAWATMLTGLLFSRKNAVILAGTALLAALMIIVTEMNLMDPDITPLQPVLKSYWLMIHVAIITGSYGPLGISCILGILNLLLYIFRTKKNGKLISSHINELTYVSEMTMTIGVFMLTIGTFLGGIWANESWGRYWGWDPKETWALVAVLTYAVILHLRYIPALKGKFLFNAVGMWGYASILFTFFGVNFYLVGLHSYAQGEGLGKIPNSLVITVFVFVIFTIIAAWRNRVYKKQNSLSNEA